MKTTNTSTWRLLTLGNPTKKTIRKAVKLLNTKKIKRTHITTIVFNNYPTNQLLHIA